MAIDTKGKRMSVIGLNLPVPSLLPEPDGEIASADRQHLLWLYSGIAIAEVIRKVIEFVVYLHNRTVATQLYARVITVNLFPRTIKALLHKRTISIKLFGRTITLRIGTE